MPPHRFHPAFVVPRYGADVVGGAEDLARRTAEELVRRGFEVTVLTTRALDHQTWRGHYPPGPSVLNGVRVIRFEARTRVGDPELHALAARIEQGAALSDEEQRLWLEGVVASDALNEHIRTEGPRYTHLIFLPYLFGTTFTGSSIHPERSWIIPCLHDEPFAHMSLIKKMMRSVRGLIFNSPGERRFASRLLGVEDPGPVVGMGFRPIEGDPRAFRNRYPVRGDFALYAGRREPGKNTPLLVDYFRAYALENPGAKLVLMGAGNVRIPAEASHFIFDLGRVSEPAKWDGYAAARVFCQPSVNESLSIVLLESWLAGTPALVNRRCAVTGDHVRESGGGLAFDCYDEFAEALNILLSNEGLARELGEAGRQYVVREYNWDSVMERFLRALGAVV